MQLKNRKETLQLPKDMQGTAVLNTATSHEIADDDTLTTDGRTIINTSLPRLKHYKGLNDEVTDTYLSKICNQHMRSKSKCIQSLYTERLMDDYLNYISDPRILTYLSRIDILRDIQLRQETTGNTGDGQQVSMPGLHDDRKRKPEGPHEITDSKRRQPGALATKARKR